MYDKSGTYTIGLPPVLFLPGRTVFRSLCDVPRHVVVLTATPDVPFLQRAAMLALQALY